MFEADLSGKTVAFTSTNGTKVLSLLSNAKEIVTSSFINHTATLNWLSGKNDIWIVRADRPDGKSEEDSIYSEFLEKSLNSEGPDPSKYTDLIRKCNGARTLERLGYSRDVEMALRLDLVDFPVMYSNGRFVRG